MIDTTHRHLGRLLFVLALALAPLLASTPAQAASGGCTTSAGTVTCTFNYTGGAETWSVPAGVTSATFQLVGGPGGQSGGLSFPHLPGGMGARVTADMPLTPGTTVTVVVGGPGGSTGNEGGGFNGGGGAPYMGNIPMQGGGGGGATDIRIGGTELANRVLVAGGGGGGGGYGGGNGPIGSDGVAGGPGGNADTSGSQGVGLPFTEGGQGGLSGSAGGQGGAAGSGGETGGDGSSGLGGNRGEGGYPGGNGGGGGGGYVGGGGGGGGGGSFDAETGNVLGSGGGGGGGGSSFADPSATNVTTATDTTGQPQVVITYAVPADPIPPGASPSPSPEANSAGWNKTDVTVDWRWADSGSGLNLANCTQTSTSSGEGEQTLSASCTDQAGNIGSASYIVKVDTTVPTIALANRTAPNGNGWNNGAVTVNWTCDDVLSGAVSASVSQTVSSEGQNQSASGGCADNAGNSASDTQTGINIDLTAPTLSPVVSPNPVPLGGSATAVANASDSLSGIASQSCGALDTTSVGTKTVTCTATDSAGNMASASVTYQVAYHWSGFFQPIDNLPAVNSAKAGQAIQVKFSLGGDYGLSIFASGYPKVQMVNCSSGAPIGQAEQTVTASGLHYNAGSGQYSYTWKTDKSWRGTCGQLVVRLVDGSEHIASFTFR
jgi:hypothetical protein